MSTSVVERSSINAPFCENSLHDLRDLRDLVAGSISVKDAFRCVASRICQSIDSDGAKLFLLDQDRKHLVEAAAWGDLENQEQNADRLPLGNFSTRRPTLGPSDKLRTSPLSATVPLTRNREIVGVLQLYFNGPVGRPDQLPAALEVIQELVSQVTIRAMIYERNIARAHLDTVTDLPNERSFKAHCEKLAARAKDGDRPFSVAVIDIKNFAGINEILGYGGGDLVLRWVAEIARRNLRDMDTIARSHKDEFLILLPTASELETLAIISRIGEGIGGKDLPLEFCKIQKVELNFGWGVLGRDGDSPSSLLTRARLRKDLPKKHPATQNLLMFSSSKERESSSSG